MKYVRKCFLSQMLVKVVDYYLQVVWKDDMEIMAYIISNKKGNPMKVNEVTIEERGNRECYGGS